MLRNNWISQPQGQRQNNLLGHCVRWAAAHFQSRSAGMASSSSSGTEKQIFSSHISPSAVSSSRSGYSSSQKDVNAITSSLFSQSGADAPRLLLCWKDGGAGNHWVLGLRMLGCKAAIAICCSRQLCAVQVLDASLDRFANVYSPLQPLSLDWWQTFGWDFCGGWTGWEHWPIHLIAKEDVLQCSFVWNKYIQTLSPAPSHHPSLLGVCSRKSLSWNDNRQLSKGQTRSSVFTSPLRVCLFLCAGLGEIGTSASRFASLHLQKNNIESKVGCILCWVPERGRRRGQGCLSPKDGGAQRGSCGQTRLLECSAPLLGSRSQGPCCHPVILGENVVNPKLLG